MPDISRRSFLKYAASLAAMMGLNRTASAELAESLSKISANNPAVLWLQGQSCSGCSVSLLNSTPLGIAEIVTRKISLLFHSTLSTATGYKAMEVIDKSVSAGGYILVVEGSIPTQIPEACVVGGKNFADQIIAAARASIAVVAVGTCATWGGIPAAEGNLTGAQSVPDFLKSAGISKPVVRIPGCPSHPDWIVGTLAFVAAFGLSKLVLDDYARPKMFFNRHIHEQCPRFADYEREKFAGFFGDEGCLFRLGCLGPVTKADCTFRLWNGGVNTCIKANAPCIGCSFEGFTTKRDLPLVTYGQPKSSDSDRVSNAVKK
ncbi:MAG: hydrogenase small subunit [Candidatus Riflebacteria bacterium]|nr:hydrogenase small subunit [Candidatus Riflebacteria bacterium]